MSSIVVLRLYKNGELVEVKQFEEGQIVVGRSVEAQLVVDDQSVSPLHAVVEKRDSGYFISDLGSETGIVKNGERVLEQSLTSGDEFQIGDYVIQFFIGVPAVNAHPVEEKVTEAESFAGKVAATPPQEIPKKKSKEDTKRPPAPKGTFAPDSAVKDLKKIIKPEKGTVVEVVVAWQERVIDTFHFNESRDIYVGSDESCDIVIPLLGTNLLKHKMIRIDSLAHALVNTTMAGEYIEGGKSSKSFADLSKTNRMQKKGKFYKIEIAQGDMLIVTLAGGLVSIYIRYVSETPMPLMAPLLDLTASEVTGVILAVVVAAIFGLYMMVYAPEELDEDAKKSEEPIRIAKIEFTPPRPKKIVTVGTETKKKVVVVKKKVKKAASSAKKSGKPGKAASLKKAPKQAKKVSSKRKKGGSKKFGKRGSTAKTKRKDPTKMGLLSVFGGKGMNKKLNKGSDGAGGLIGLADQATGKAGFQEDRPGANLGGRLKSTDAGGSGKASVGIGGPVTKGKGSGAYGYGSGGIGNKGSVQINIGGQEEAFVGTIDREAIRRVIMDNIRQIRHCYEKELNRNPDMFGKLVLQWDIIDRGRVRNAIVVKNTLGSRRVANCVKNRLAKWRFPEPPEDQVARVTYPFVFASK